MEFLTQIFIQFGHFFSKIKELSIFSWLTAFMIALYSNYLVLIGYPKPVLSFIAFLFISDFITRFLAQLVLASKSYASESKHVLVYLAGLLFYAYRERYLSSRKFFYGVFVKIIAYTFLLGVAEFATKNSDLILISFVPSLSYGSLVVYDIKSNLENLADIGWQNAKDFLGIFSRKVNQLENNN